MTFVFAAPLLPPSPLRAAIRKATRMGEEEAAARILAAAAIPAETREKIAAEARRLVLAVRRERTGKGGIDTFLSEYALSSEEGVALLCLAEALLRIPDSETAERLIRDKIADADWESHLGHSDSFFVNASTWALMLTGRLLRTSPTEEDWRATLRRLLARSSEPLARQAITAAMRILGAQFVIGRTIEEALERAEGAERANARHSFDMLGEAARTEADALRYLAAYKHAIAAIGKAASDRELPEVPGISVKLSALHPRFEFAQRERVLAETGPRLLALAREAREAGISLTIDAEEADRLELMLDLFEGLAEAPGLGGWEGLGLAVQAYQKRALPLIDWLADLAKRARRRLQVRLVKGAYWDSEIKRSQELGLSGYPVFTRKVATDVSYIACAKRLLAAGPLFYPQFATHNAATLATVATLAGGRRDFEFQRLFGMGEALYEAAASVPCRIYAPVGSHEHLLPYLVRRLVENGANTSFVNRILDSKAPVETLVADPMSELSRLSQKLHPRIPLPRDLYQPARQNSAGLDLSDPLELARLKDGLQRAFDRPWTAFPIIGGAERAADAAPVFDPSDRRRTIGAVREASRDEVEEALGRALGAASDWDATSAAERAAILERAALLYEREGTALMALVIREGGRTIGAALAELREAADALRYYAQRARAEFLEPERLPGPTGETNELSLHGRGVFCCISPWNFPLAIFAGQIAAALAAGNAVVAKPAEETPLTAAAALRLLHEAGVPGDVLHLLPGRGEEVGAALVADSRIAGVAFTGSTETARTINLALAARAGPILPLIAETGGQNAMIVDSSALFEQVVEDVLSSAFDSAGQRCSALRILCLQEEIAEGLLRMLEGAMAELKIGDPALLETDIGPVITPAARDGLLRHAERMTQEGRLLYACPLPAGTEHGTYFAPRAYLIDRPSRLEKEVFGPALHILRWRPEGLDSLLSALRATGYALTLGIHSRIDGTRRRILARLPVGNSYVNRNMIGAVIGVQPFGGEGLSGTGPKAGGPRYLHRFATERTLSTDTTAAGGNASLLSLAEAN